MKIVNFEKGQEVLYSSGCYKGFYDLCIIEKITPKGFIKVNGIYYIDNGNGIAYARGKYNYGRPFIKNDKNAIKYFKMRMFVLKVKKRINNTELTYFQAKEIDKILNRGEE